MSRLASTVTMVLLLLTACAQPPDTSEPKSALFMIGTGSSSGVYYVVGQAVCRLYMRQATAAAPNCTAPATGGSAANLKALAAREIDMAVVHSEWTSIASQGSRQFAETGAMTDLRAIASFYPEPLNILVRRQSGIDRLDDLPKARIGLRRNSWAAEYFGMVMAAKGWSQSSFMAFQELQSAKATYDAFCAGDVDVIVTSVGHPSGYTREVITDCGAQFLSIAGPEIEEEISGSIALSLAKIPAGVYGGQNAEVPTFGPRPLLVTRADAPEEVVRAVTEAIFSNLDRFKDLHPAFASMSPQEMVSASIPVPLHPAAAAYYREIGLLN